MIPNTPNPEPTQPPTPRTTTRGTPCAASWTEEWIARVEEREGLLNRRICGARTIGGQPCPQPADHASGRCRHHGGFLATGAPRGNRNAVIHGLYARRLAMVGTHNPGWQSDPLGGGAHDEGAGVLKLSHADRAVCPFELAEYNAVVTDLMQRTCASGNNPMGLHLAHQVALLTVMVSRAARALAYTALTQTMEQSTETYRMSVEQPSAALTAFEKLSAELRRWMAHIEKHYPLAAEVVTETAVECELRREYDTRVDPDSLAALAATRPLVDEQFAAQRAEQRAAANTLQALARAEAANMAKWDVEHFRQRTGQIPAPPPAWDLIADVRKRNGNASNVHTAAQPRAPG